MAQKERFKILLFPGWQQLKNPEGPITFTNSTDDTENDFETANVLQLSYALYKGGEVPKPTKNDLVEMSKNLSLSNGFTNLISVDSGKCNYGIYGTAAYKNEQYCRFQIWHLSNGRDFIFATYICGKESNLLENEEAHGIVMTLDLKIEITKPWWKIF